MESWKVPLYYKKHFDGDLDIKDIALQDIPCIVCSLINIMEVMILPFDYCGKRW